MSETVTLLVCTFNEEKNIGACIDAISLLAVREHE